MSFHYIFRFFSVQKTMKSIIADEVSTPSPLTECNKKIKLFNTFPQVPSFDKKCKICKSSKSPFPRYQSLTTLRGTDRIKKLKSCFDEHLVSRRSGSTKKAFTTFQGSKNFEHLKVFYCNIEKVNNLLQMTATGTNMIAPTVIDDTDIFNEIDELLLNLKTIECNRGYLYQCNKVEKIKWKKEGDIGLRNRETSMHELKRKFSEISSQPPPSTVTKSFSYLHLNTKDDATEAVVPKPCKPKRVSTMITNIDDYFLNSLNGDQLKKLIWQLNEIYGEKNVNFHFGKKLVENLQEKAIKCSNENLNEFEQQKTKNNFKRVCLMKPKAKEEKNGRRIRFK